MARTTFRILISALIVLVAVTFFDSISQAAPAGGQSNARFAENPASAAKRLTQQFIALRGQFVRGNAGERAAAYQAMLDTASQRRELLGVLMEQSPGEVLRLAIPAAARAGLPNSIQAIMEDEETLEGTLEVNYECSKREGRLLLGCKPERKDSRSTLRSRPQTWKQALVCGCTAYGWDSSWPWIRQMTDPLSSNLLLPSPTPLGSKLRPSYS